MKLQTTLKKLLNDTDISVAQLARACNISPQTLHNWLSGQNPRSISQLKTVADYFNVDLNYLCFGEKKEKDTSPIKEYEKEINCGLFEVVLRKVIK